MQCRSDEKRADGNVGIILVASCATRVRGSRSLVATSAEEVSSSNESIVSIPIGIATTQSVEWK